MNRGDFVSRNHIYGQITDVNEYGCYVNWFGMRCEYCQIGDFEVIPSYEVPDWLRHYIAGGVYVNGEFLSESDIRNLVDIVKKIEIYEAEATEATEADFDFAESDLYDILAQWLRLRSDVDKGQFMAEYANYIQSVQPLVSYQECMDRALSNIHYLENR